MNLTTAQKVTLAAHLNANTNTSTAPDGTDGAVINTSLAGRDPTRQQYIADWYNATALVGDAQALANLNIWNPTTTITQINTALDWALNPIGAVDAIITNSWLKWQSMCWSNVLDFADGQVRLGVVSVWGSNTTNSNSLGSLQAGKVVGKRVELALAGNVVATAGINGGARVVPKGLAGAVLFGVLLTAIDIDKALFPNG